MRESNHPIETVDVPTSPIAQPDESEGKTPWWRLAFYFLASRGIILLAAWLSMKVINKGAFYNHPQRVRDWFVAWDATWYLDLARDGYYYLPDARSSATFFPLYPLLMKIFGGIFHNLRLSGYFVSNLALFVSCGLLWKLLRRDYKRPEAGDQAVLFLMFGPVSFFFSAIYTESVFFCFMIGAIYFAGGGRWLMAAACGYLATLTRHVGLLLMAPLALEYFQQVQARRALAHPGASWREGWRPALGDLRGALICLAAPALGLATYMAYLQYKFGEPLAFQKANVYWGRHLTLPWQTFTNEDAINLAPFYRVWFFSAVILAVALIILGACLRLRLSHQVICPMYLLLYISTSLLESIPRYLSVLFPFYVALGLLAARWPKLGSVMLTASTALLTLATILFVNGYWFT